MSWENQMIRLRYFLVINKSEERPQVVDNDYRMLLCKVTVKLGHSFHFSRFITRCSSTARIAVFQTADVVSITITGSMSS